MITQTDVQLSAVGIALAGLGDTAHSHQNLQLRLDLFEESIVLTHYDDGGKPVTCYEVGPDDLASAFTGIPLSTGLLPRDCLFYARRDGQELIAIYIPPGRRTLVAWLDPEQKVEFDVPLPGFVFTGQGGQYRIFAVKQRPGERERLFRPPLPNVFDDGRICAGNVNFPPCTATTIHEAVELFFASEFNHDLAQSKSAGYKENVLDLWIAIDGQETFPFDDLVKTHLVLEDLWTKDL